MNLWETSKKRIFDKRMDQGIQRMISMAATEWPFTHWEFQVGKTGAFRTEAQQKEMVEKGASKTMNSKHREGKAIDITLYNAGTEKPIWDRTAYTMVAGFMVCCAKQTNVDITWGGNWDNDNVILEEDNWEVDLVHYEVD